MNIVKFRPLSRGRYRCYVNGRMIDIITRKCNVVRNQFEKNTTVKKDAPSSLPNVYLDRDGDYRCSSCNNWNLHPTKNKEHTCKNCGRRVFVVG